MSLSPSKSNDKMQNKGECPEQQKCVEMLNLLLDGEASSSQKDYINEHIKNCIPCNEDYEMEKAIRTLLQQKCNNMKAPKDLVDLIRHKINHKAL